MTTDVVDIGRGNPTGTLWLDLDESPELPESLPHMRATHGASLRWFSHPGRPGEEVYGAVAGNSGVEGAYVLGVYVLAGEGTEPRYPTFEEWTSLAHHACLPGAILACQFIVGSLLITPAEGRCLFVTQNGCAGNTPAAQRWVLSNPGGMIRGQA
jgi:hypothetical protein